MKLRSLLLALPVFLFSAPATDAAVSVSISFPGVSIGLNVPTYPQLILVPGYPVYYDPQAQANYFFYDGMYWVYQNDNWYASTWYNGPWYLTSPEYVPLFVLRVPVRYYRQPPVYFRGWRQDAPPHWGAHWGRDWEQRRSGWDQWDHRATPPAAPLPVYQRQFSGDRYPRAIAQQEAIRAEHYRYQPREAVTRQHLEQRSRHDSREGDRGNGRIDRQAQPPVPRQKQPEPRDDRRNQKPQPKLVQPALKRQPEPQPQLNQPAPRGPAQRTAPQGKVREDRGNPHDQGRADKSGARDNEKGNRRSERDQDRR